MHGNDIRLITFADGEYKPAVGEILAKDSILYQQKPESRLLRRQLWPIMQETMNTLVDSLSSVAVGANLFKNMLTTNSNPIATKIRNIKNAYMSATSPMSHKKFVKTPTMKKIKKMKPTPVRTRTVSEDYVHTYDDGAYTVPTYVVKSSSKNPYAEMGLKDYKHFEETVLRELEEKEEKKVEATMASLFNKKPTNVEEELIQGIQHNGWRPVKSNHVDEIPNKAKQVGKLHTSIAHSNIKPIHENAHESRTMSQVYETIIEQPETKSRRRKPNYIRSTTTSTTTATPPRPFTRKSTQDGPNYPEYFLKKHNSPNKDNQNSKDVAQEMNYMKRMKFYREHIQGLSAVSNSSSITHRPPIAMQGALVIDASNEQSVYITPVPKFSEHYKNDDKKVPRLNRQKNKTTTDGKTWKSDVSNRGSIKFSDRL